MHQKFTARLFNSIGLARQAVIILALFFGISLSTSIAKAAESLEVEGQSQISATQTQRNTYQFAHCCHTHSVYPYDRYCCHPSTYVAPAYRVGPASVRGVSRRTARRTSRRVGRRR
jgi:hypothetical protein